MRRGTTTCILLAALFVFISPQFLHAGVFGVYGPQLYVRVDGEPITVSNSFRVKNTSTNYTLRVRNGGLVDDVYDKVSSTVVYLNGQLVISPNELNQNTPYLEKAVVLQQDNVIDVQVRGKPGGALSIDIVGEDDDPPVIVPGVSPNPNEQGWNNSPVTVTFQCSDALSGIASCTEPTTIHQEGKNQQIIGTATDVAGNTSTVTVSLSIDLTPPVITIGSPLDGSVSQIPQVSINGTASDSLSGISKVTCNGIAASFSGDSLNCTLSLVLGANTLLTQATDAAGNSAQTSVSVTYSAEPVTTPDYLVLTPSTMTVALGQDRTLSLVDQDGKAFPYASLASSDPSIAEIQSGVQPILLTHSIGEVTITATYGSVVTTAIVTVVDGPDIPEGAVRWSVSPLPGFQASDYFPAPPTDGTTPSLYVLERSSLGTAVRALDIDGRQQWVHFLQGPPGTSTAAAVSSMETATQTDYSGFRDLLNAARKVDPIDPELAMYDSLFADDTPQTTGTKQASLPDAKAADLAFQSWILSGAKKEDAKQFIQQAFESNLMSPAIAQYATTGRTELVLDRVSLTDSGTLLRTFTVTGGYRRDLVRLAANGHELWRFALPVNTYNVPNHYAIAPNGTIYFLLQNSQLRQVATLDSMTGTFRIIASIPMSTFNYSYCDQTPGTANYPANLGWLFVDPNGIVNLPFEQYVQQNTYVDCTNNNEVSASLQDSIKLLQIAPDGTTTEKILFTKSSNYIFDTSTVDVATWPHYLRPTEAVPDNDNGFLVEYADFVATYDAQYRNLYAQMYLLHAPSSGDPSTFALPYDSHAHSPIMVGQNGIVYMGNLATTIGFDYINGALKWEVPLGGIWIDPLLAATEDTEQDQFIGLMGNSVVRVSDTGELSYDGWATSSTSPTLGSATTQTSRILGTLEYTLPLTWTAYSDGNVAQVNGHSTATAASKWNKSNQDRQRLAGPGLILRAIQDCTVDSVRIPQYKLVDRKLKLPDKNYTVFELLNPVKEPALCKDSNGDFTGMSPCQYADGSSDFPYNEFDDNLWLNPGRKEFTNLQYFQYGLPNERKWGVSTILITTSNNPLQTKQKSPAAYNVLQMKHSGILIDGHAAPYLAPWDGKADSCNGRGAF